MDNEKLANRIYDCMVLGNMDSWNCREIREIYNVDNLDIEAACDEHEVLEMSQICGNYHVIRG